jgi:hypothetical protein
MENRVLYQLVGEIRQQCRFAQLAWENLKRHLQMNDGERVFLHVHALLSHGINLSKLFWPDEETARTRGDTLRTELKVEVGSPLELREARAQQNRFDAGLVEWLALHERPVDLNIMPQGTLSGFKEDEFHRSLDPESWRLTYRGVSLDLRKVWQETRQVEASAEAWLRSHNPW